VSALEDVLIDRADGAVIDLRQEGWRFPELIEPFVPPRFNHRLRHGSRLFISALGKAHVEISLEFWPRGSSDAPENLSAASRVFSTEGAFADHQAFFSFA
jgi:hypothetical protein